MAWVDWSEVDLIPALCRVLWEQCICTWSSDEHSSQIKGCKNTNKCAVHVEFHNWSVHVLSVLDLQPPVKKEDSIRPAVQNNQNSDAAN